MTKFIWKYNVTYFQQTDKKNSDSSLSAVDVINTAYGLSTLSY